MILRRLGIRGRLILSLLLVLVVPLGVSLATLAIALELLVPRAESAYVGRIEQSLETDFLPDAIRKLRLGEIQALLARGASDEITAIVEEVWPALSPGDRAEIVRTDGTVLFTIGGGVFRFGEIEITRDAAVIGALRLPEDPRVAPLGIRSRVIPGLSFVTSGIARYVWPLPSDEVGQLFGRYTFAVPGSARAVETVSGSYTLVSVGAGIVTFAILGLILFLRLSRAILIPLGRLSRASEDIAVGNLDVPVVVDREDELGKLAAAFEEMRVRLRESLLRLQRGDAERRQMVASVSHDLKTPLTSIRGYVEGLRDGVADNPEARDRYFAVILQKASQLDTLIDGLSRISRLELGDEELDLRPESSLRLFAELSERARRDTEAAGRRFVLAAPLPDVLLLVDRASIAQVVDNLVQNSLRHAAGATMLCLAAVLRDRVLDVSVSDDGPGFAPADLPHVFDLFYRGDAARTQGGAGLGLAICRRLVEKHGGSVSAESRGGAVVTFRLPVAEPSGEPRR